MPAEKLTIEGYMIQPYVFLKKCRSVKDEILSRLILVTRDLLPITRHKID